MAKSNGINLNGLNRFKSTLNDLMTNNLAEMKKAKLEEFSNLAYSILNRNYGGTEFEVEPPKIEDNKSTIYAKGDEIAFDEFGTGFYAEGSYKGQVPKMPLSFESAGYPQFTPKWIYYYDWKGPANKNPKRTTKDGRVGWFTSKETPKFQTGQMASNRFYDSVVEIKKKVKGE